MQAHEDSYHYQTIARALAIIENAHSEKRHLSLAELSGSLGMSESHFHKVFSAWVGVSPQRYDHYLSMMQARDLLRRRQPLSMVAHTLGLSGTARLHDLLIRWEAMTPGTYAAKGAGLQIFWGKFRSRFGPVLAMATTRGLCGVAFYTDIGEQAAFADLAKRWPAAQIDHAPDQVASFLRPVLSHRGETHIVLSGRPFQLKVWEALLQIPSGGVATYSDIAQAIDAPKSVRAVGTAVGRNPIAQLIPCHRVIRTTGELGGYHWGLGVKRALLLHEAAHTSPDHDHETLQFAQKLA
ncbi:methylated-DNA--[protein]-cysteine S-methyltransferase [Rhodobacteraceae bacterium]|nr:methylated-DNA--[protein]-cysteine S-methyltransferase [Paracoccaceae bacterium]